MARPPAAPAPAELPAETPDARRVDPNRVLQKLQLLDANLVQLAMLQVVVEDQEAELAALRSELVAATSGRPAAA